MRGTQRDTDSSWPGEEGFSGVTQSSGQGSSREVGIGEVKDKEGSKRETLHLCGRWSAFGP